MKKLFAFLNERRERKLRKELILKFRDCHQVWDIKQMIAFIKDGSVPPIAS